MGKFYTILQDPTLKGSGCDNSKDFWLLHWYWWLIPSGKLINCLLYLLCCVGKWYEEHCSQTN